MATALALLCKPAVTEATRVYACQHGVAHAVAVAVPVAMNAQPTALSEAWMRACHHQCQPGRHSHLCTNPDRQQEVEQSTDQMYDAVNALLSIQPILQDRDAADALLSVSPHLQTATPSRMPPPFNLLAVFSGIADMGKDALSHISRSKLGSPTVRRTCNLTPAPGEHRVHGVSGLQPLDIDGRDFSVANKDGRIGVYKPEARKALLAKFHRKRHNRIWNKKVRYTCRKNLADTRVRIKGRFVKRVGVGDVADAPQEDAPQEGSATLMERTNTMVE